MRVQAYLGQGLNCVDGWLEPASAEIIQGISQIQKELGTRGTVGEIGVHHGKLFILLHADANSGTKSFALDLFEEQHLNIDNSGRGDQSIFTQNVAQWTGALDTVEIIKTSSLLMTPESFAQKVGPVRLISIDGGHTEECAFHDLGLAEGCLVPGGVVILDDVFNPHWPGVVTGFAKYAAQNNSALKPFAISPNKVYLTDAISSPILRRPLKERFPTMFDKESLFFGAPVDIYGIAPPYVPTMQIARQLASRIADSAGRKLRIARP